MKRSGEFDSSGDPAQKRPTGSRPNTSGPMPCVLKFLTPAPLASAIIGKGGSVIAEMRQKTQTKISLTSNNDLFPGTDCRILTASGNTQESLGELSNLIIAKVNETVQVNQNESLGMPGDLKLQVLVPKTAVGGIIGKGGNNVKLLRESSGGKISISEPVGQGPASEQVVILGGSQQSLEFLMAEINKHVQAMGSEPWFQVWATSNTSPGGSGSMGAGGSSMGSTGKGAGKHGGGPEGYTSMDPGVDLMMDVVQNLPTYVLEDERGYVLNCVIPNTLVGGIIGRAGTGTKEVQTITGAKIGIREISGDADNRSLNIAGPIANVCAAYMLMMKRFLDSEAAASQRNLPA